MKLPSVSERAARKIAALMEKLPTKFERDEYLPTVAWMIGSSNASDVTPGPCLGIHRKSDVPAEFIQEAHGVKVAYNLPDDVRVKHENSVLDFLGENFVFIEKTAIRFLGEDNSI